MAPHLARIDIFPIKSLDGMAVTQATVLESGALGGDRAYALVDSQGRFINGKRNAAVHSLRTSFAVNGQVVILARPGQTPSSFPLQPPQPELEAWLGTYFQQPVRLQENLETGFPDDTAAVGPTLISTATLVAVAAWYPGLTVDELRRRLRTNLEIDGVPAFWEDRLFGPTPASVRFAIGEVLFDGINPCQRCIVPSRDAVTGEATPRFQATFSQRRAETLPNWTHPARFNHYYRLAVNTNILNQGGRRLTVGDGVTLVP